MRIQLQQYLLKTKII